MKKIIIALAAMLTFTGIASADHDRPIQFENLPEKARKFVKAWFPDEKLAFAKQETDFMEVSYEVMFVTGTKVEFNSTGEWTEVNCRYSTLKPELVPSQIVSSVSQMYPDVKFVKIEKNYRGYEVELTNGLELTYNQAFELVDIDD